MNETNRTYPNLVAKIQVCMSNTTKNSNYFSLLRKSGSYEKMLNFMAIIYLDNLYRTGFSYMYLGSCPSMELEVKI